jgi:hypothetical protein
MICQFTDAFDFGICERSRVPVPGQACNRFRLDSFRLGRMGKLQFQSVGADTVKAMRTLEALVCAERAPGAAFFPVL